MQHEGISNDDDDKLQLSQRSSNGSRRRERGSSRSSSRRKTSEKKSSSRSPKRETSERSGSRSSRRRASGDSKRRSSSRSSSRHRSSSSRRRNSGDGRRSTSERSPTSSSRRSRRYSADGASKSENMPDPLSLSDRTGGSAGSSQRRRGRRKTKAPSRHNSADSMLSMGTMGVLSEDEEMNLHSDDDGFTRKSKRRLHQEEDVRLKSSFHDDRTLCTIYSDDAATKASKDSAEIHLVSRTTLNTLYGNDADAKAKAKASSGNVAGMIPGVQEVSTNSTAVTTLYGKSDAYSKAKAKASIRQSIGRPGVETVAFNASTHTAVSTLYGSEADSKAKACSGQYASTPGVETVAFNASSHTAVSTLYGSDADANKAKAKASSGRSELARNLGGASSIHTAPTVLGRERHVHAAMDTISLPMYLHENDVENDAKEPVAKPLSINIDSRPRSIIKPAPKPISNPIIGPPPEGIINMDDGLRIPNDPEAPRLRGPPDEKEIDEEEQKWKRRSALVLFLLFLVGVAIALWLLLYKKDSNDQDTSIRSSLTRNSTGAPSAAPYGMDFWASSSPTETPFYENLLFQPPSEDNCEKIALNETIAGREDMEDADFSLGLDVVLSESNTMTEPLVKQLLDAIQEKILPSLAGCKIPVNEYVEAWRFVIFDAFVSGNVETGERCKDANLATRNCHLMSVQLDLFLKGRVRFLDIIDLISDEEENISRYLGLSDPFSVVKLVRIDNLTPTASPSAMPSDVPSSTLSGMPTPQDSTNPTGLPTASPSKYVSGVPTRSPSVIPSLAPSMNPSIAPTELPSHYASASPSETPSQAPSFVPSTRPSANPTESPSARPSFRPTNAPSRTPTAQPSRSPTKAPSVQPTISPAPSSVPSPRPSTSPSASPSKSPTAFPSSVPSVTSLYYVACGRGANTNRCNGDPASVQNANYINVGGVSTGLEIAVRCCAEIRPTGFQGPTQSGCPFADSEINSVCYDAVTYFEAVNVCTSVGARLCTLAEIELGCTRGTGCSHDNRMVWTSTPGP